MAIVRSTRRVSRRQTRRRHKQSINSVYSEAGLKRRSITWLESRLVQLFPIEKASFHRPYALCGVSYLFCPAPTSTTPCERDVWEGGNIFILSLDAHACHVCTCRNINECVDLQKACLVEIHVSNAMPTHTNIYVKYISIRAWSIFFHLFVCMERMERMALRRN